MVDDKDIDAVMELLPKDAFYYWTQAKTKRAIPSDKVMQKGLQHHLQGEDCGDIEKAYQQALQNADKDDFVFVGGSNYVVSDLLLLNDF